MPKILHIGGANSPHVLGIMEQIKRYTNFQQVLVSYPTNIREADKPLLQDIPIYYYNYPMFFTSKVLPIEEEKKLRSFVKNIVKKECPDIIQGHYLSKCAVITSCFIEESKRPGIVNPWSVWDIPTNNNMKKRNGKCIQLCSYVMCNHPRFLANLLQFFKQPNSKKIFAGPPIRLHLYEDSKPDTSVPKLLIARRHYQDILMKALPRVFSEYPELQVTAWATFDSDTTKIISLTKALGIFDKINFMYETLPQEQFASIIKQHNIVRTMAPDQGNSGTTMQAAYFGAVTLVNKTPWDFLKDGVNVIKCDLTVKDMEAKLLYSIKNIKTLCPMFKKNNAVLKSWDAKETWKNLYGAYKRMLRM